MLITCYIHYIYNTVFENFWIVYFPIWGMGNGMKCPLNRNGVGVEHWVLQEDNQPAPLASHLQGVLLPQSLQGHLLGTYCTMAPSHQLVDHLGTP